MDQFEVGNMFVHPNYRKIGLGFSLIQHVILEAEKTEIKSILLEVRESNETARRLYLKAGFSESGARKNYYDGIETAILMQMNL